MASAPSAATRRIHSFEGGGGRSSGTTAQGIDRVGQGVRKAVLEKKTIDSNFAKKTDAFSEDEDEPLSVGRSTRDMEAAPRTTAPSVAVASSTSTSRVGNTGSGSSGGAGTRGEGSALGAEKKRGISEAGRMVGSGGGTGPPLTKKLRVGTGGIIEKTKMDPDDEDEDDVPLAMRMKSKNVPSSDESLSSKLAAAKAAKKLIEEKNKGTSKGLVAMPNLTPNGDTLQGTASTGRRLSAEVQERTGTSVSRTRDETQQDRKVPAREDAGNSVPDSDDSDDDKPLSYRKSMTLSLGKGPKPENKETTEAQMKKRSAGTISSPSNVKKLKVVASGRATPKLSVQSPKSGSLQSPRAAVKREGDFSPRRTSRRSDLSNNDDDDDVPLAQRMMSMNGKSTTMKKSTTPSKAEPDSDEDDDNMPLAKRVVAVAKPQAVKKVVAAVKKPAASSGKSIAKKVLEQRRKGKGTVKVSKKVVQTKVTSKSSNVIVSGGTKKWDTLEHCGVIFPPSYQPHGVKMLYKGKPVTLTPDQEEIATMFAVMKDTDYATKPKFLSNFWTDWKPILGKNHVIQDFENCDFTPIYEWHLAEKEKKKSMTSEEKKKAREDKLKAEDKYMWALVNGVKEKVGNFRVEPPGLFRGRGEHPKMGKVKKRIFPENIVINVGKGAPIPECPMPGHKWKEVRHDDTVTWLAFWNDPINTKEFKYVFLAPSSTLKGQSDMEKYEKARLLKDHIENIRKTYTKNFGSQDPVTRQIAVATYLIDRLALRAGNEKDEDEAETVGCCSLKVEHVILVPPRSLTFDFLGKDSIRYFNTVEVEEKVYKAIGDFKKGKRTGNDLFDKLDTSKLNTHLKGIMPALTAKVFRTYNASITLDNLLQDTVGSTAPEKVADYQRANKEVAILCNHQRTVSKSHSSQMEKLEAKMAEAEDLIKELKVDLDRVKKGKPPLKDSEGKPKKNQSRETLERKIAQTQQRVEKMKLDMRIKDDLKTVALGTSKINYMDPRISVAWCKRHEVPIEKVFNKSLLAKFAWAMDVEPDYRF